MIHWAWCTFENLNSTQLYDVLQLREQVFTIGQQCSDPDIDGKDKNALHLLGYEGGKLVAYLRVYTKQGRQSIGRVVVHPDAQGKGVGRELMTVAIAYLREAFPGQEIIMSAQLYLERFYQSFGFETEGDVYLEAGIEHVLMRKK